MDLVETVSNVVVIIAAFLGAFIAALWLSLVIWTFRDIRARSRDIFAQILATLVVAILNLPGLLIYIMVRPRETLAEAYDRSLEEEALLQSIEERENCPGCSQRISDDWVICPFCHTRLRKSCHHCGRAIHLRWTVCPYCGSADRPAAITSPPMGDTQPIYQPEPTLTDVAEAPVANPELDEDQPFLDTVTDA
jgi:RNA polymerase subunit RPABC4/transcription elongation factor Spt4